jgi:hypothetical protein|tara:strand:+ start:2985 stop:3224 length:240 start_codon:yes stop_codon:yes gene_type:complete
MKYAKVEQVSKKDKIEDTKELIEKLEKENNKLKDELDSLWLMMDEMQKADIKNWSHLMEELKKDVLTKSLMTTKKKAEC